MHFSSDYQQRKRPLFVRPLIHFLQSPRFGRNIKTNIQKAPTLFKLALISWMITQIEHLKHQHIQLQCVHSRLSGFHEFDFSWTILVLNPTIKLAWHRQNSSEREVLRVKQLFIREVCAVLRILFHFLIILIIASSLSFEHWTWYHL